MKLAGAGDLWLFIVSGVAIIPLAGLMGRATENLAETLGPALGGLLNATLGNPAELIIALMVLLEARNPVKAARMFGLVKASIHGWSIGNVLLVFGLAAFLGGLRYPRQTFNRTSAGMGTTLLALATFGLIAPTIFYYVVQIGGQLTPEKSQSLTHLSEEI